MKRGMTTVELLAVVGTTAVLTTLVASCLRSAPQRGADAKYDAIVAAERCLAPEAALAKPVATFKAWRTPSGGFVVRDYRLYNVNIGFCDDEYTCVQHRPEMEADGGMLVMHSVAEQDKGADGECVEFTYRGMRYAVMLLKKTGAGTDFQILGKSGAVSDGEFLASLASFHGRDSRAFWWRDYMAHNVYKTRWFVGDGEYISVVRDDAGHVCIKFNAEKGTPE